MGTAVDENDTLTIKRIMVALDASDHSQAAMDAAAGIAELLHAELVGVFVEDINLLRVAQLPFVREVEFPIARVSDIDEPRMESQLRELAAQVQRQLREVATHHNVRWSFRVRRGRVATELLEAALESDLLALGRIGRSLMDQERLGSTARTAVARARGSLLIMRIDVDLSQPVLTIYDGTAGAKRALQVAAVLARLSGRLHVLIRAAESEQAQQFRQEIVHLTHPDDDDEPRLELSYRRMHPEDDGRLHDLVAASDVGILVLGREGTAVAPEALTDLLERLSVPVLLVR